jgi:hypothetical protein
MDAASYGQQYANFLAQLSWIARLKPLALAYKFAILSAKYSSPHLINRTRVMANIESCLGAEQAKPAWKSFVRHTGVANCNIFRIKHITPMWLQQHVEITGNGWSHLANNKAVFILTYHNHHPFLFTVAIGSLGRLIRTLAMNPEDSVIYPYIATIYRKYFDDCAAHYNGGNFILVDANTPNSATRSIYHTLRNKQIVISLNDIFNPYNEKRITELDFYHSKIKCSLGSVEIAMRHEVEFVVGWLIWHSGAKFELALHSLDSSQGVDGIMQQYIHYLHNLIAVDAGVWEGWKFFDF